MSGPLQFLLSKVDPVQFFSPATQSNSSIAPYSVPTPASVAATARDYGAPDEGGDLASFALQNYVLAVVVSPLQVVETLSEIQYQKREAGEEHEFDVADDSTEGATSAATELTLPPLQSGLWENVREIVESDGEGWTALLKGHFTYFLFNCSFTFLQPALEEGLNDLFDVWSDTHPVTAVFSHVMVGGLLSPLDIARTRLIAQSSTSNRKKYYGPLHALHAIASEEGQGIWGLYSPRHLIPTLWLHALNPLLRYVSNHVVVTELGFDPMFSPILHSVATLVALAVETAIVTPLQLARKRIQLQRLASDPSLAPEPSSPRSSPPARNNNPRTRRPTTENPYPFSACVELAPTRYTGVLDCAVSVVRGEGGRSRNHRRRRRTRSGRPVGAEWHRVEDEDADVVDRFRAARARSADGYGAAVGRVATGVQSLYRGFWPRYASTLITFAFAQI
ncbi:mitochondrial carrier domain-containing protein, partial [Blyttiomyces helicus]